MLVDPEAGACRAAKRLFGYATLRADAGALPLRDASCDVAWSLGVLCTTSHQVGLLVELGRVVRPSGRIGLLTFVAHRDIANDDLESNHFPTPSGLLDLIAVSGLNVEHWQSAKELPPIPETWQTQIRAVERRLADKHSAAPAWQLAERQSSAIAKFLDDATLTAELLVLRHAH